MAESGFNKLQLLSQEDLIVETLQRLLKSYAELNRREEITKTFLKSLCALGVESWIWFILWEGGGAQRFTDILHVADCSRSKLSNVLQELLRMGLVRKVEARYQAVSPAWLVHARRAHVLSERCDAIEVRMEKLEVSMGARKK